MFISDKDIILFSIFSLYSILDTKLIISPNSSQLKPKAGENILDLGPFPILAISKIRIMSLEPLQVFPDKGRLHPLKFNKTNESVGYRRAAKALLVGTESLPYRPTTARGPNIGRKKPGAKVIGKQLPKDTIRSWG